MDFDANCGKAEQIELATQQNLDINVVSQAKIKRADQEEILKLPKMYLQTGQGKITIDPSLLFVRVSLILQRQTNIPDCFDYELTKLNFERTT